MAQVVNGITFPDSFTQAQIDEYLKTLNETQATQETKPEETEEETKEPNVLERGLDRV